MSGDQPYAGHNSVAVLLLSLAGLVATPWLLVHGLRLLLPARRARTFAAPLKATRSLVWAAAVGTYTWGLLHLFFFDDADRSQACATAVGTHRLTGYEPSFVPLHFGCRTSDGHTFEAVVPSYINPAVAVLGVGALALTLAGIAFARRKEEVS
ncbi:hypothetical protein [Streptomyces sp. NPDC048643]|uniref:hypothetical protein n=1 Tax=Streptomyces sp. NPDC048643 TaxID=3155637 RepID=UPI00343286C5